MGSRREGRRDGSDVGRMSGDGEGKVKGEKSLLVPLFYNRQGEVACGR